MIINGRFKSRKRVFIWFFLLLFLGAVLLPVNNGGQIDSGDFILEYLSAYISVLVVMLVFLVLSLRNITRPVLMISDNTIHICDIDGMRHEIKYEYIRKVYETPSSMAIRYVTPDTLFGSKEASVLKSSLSIAEIAVLYKEFEEKLA